jgi:hypothetical protein
MGFAAYAAPIDSGMASAETINAHFVVFKLQSPGGGNVLGGNLSSTALLVENEKNSNFNKVF